MTTTTVDHASAGTRVRPGYVVGSAPLSGKCPWRPTPQAFLGGSMINNSTGVSGVECRHR
jgi:hypothetical protein